jgi:hypothetical protein
MKAEALPRPQQGGHGRAHPTAPRVAVHEVPDALVRRGDGVRQGLVGVHVLWRGPRPIEDGERLDGDGAGHLASGMPAHAVGDDQEPGPRVAGVLVALSHQPNVRLGH